MAKNGAEFENFVKAIYEEILAYDGYDTVKVEHNVKVNGKSGQSHQLDVYWEFKIAGITHRVAVECKQYTTTISVGKVRDFFGALDDIGNIHGVFVTTKGYQSGAIKYAAHKGISLKVVHEPTSDEIDAHPGIKRIYIKGNSMFINNVLIDFNLDIDWVLEHTNMKEGDQVSFNALSNEIKVIDSNFTLLGTIQDFENKLPREPENTQGLTNKYEFADGFIHLPNSKYPPLKLKALHFKYDTYTISIISEMNSKLMAQAVLKDIITGECHLYNKSNNIHTSKIPKSV